MKSFSSFIPTRLCFGCGERKHFAEEVRHFGSRVLLVSGKGSLKKSGRHDELLASLRAQGCKVEELTDVDPNPRLYTVLKGAEICRAQRIEVVACVGGGSVMDAAKAVAAATYFTGDIWDVALCRKTIDKALPVVAMPTLAATGSEFNPHSVIINERTKQKFSLHSEHMIPKVAVLDPELTTTVPRKTTVAGAIDIIAHAFEGYLTAEAPSALADRMTEGICQSVMEATETALAHPEDLEARSTLLWSSTMACSGYAGAGYGNKFYDGHQIGHELSASWDFAHGDTLSALLPAVMRFRLAAASGKLAQFSRRVLGIDPVWTEGPQETALRGIRSFELWCKGMGAPISLKDLGVERSSLEGIADRVTANPEAANLTREEILQILDLADPA